MENQKSGGIGFLNLLTIVFITLKLTGYIDWNWFLVLSPTLVPLILACVIFIACLCIVGIDTIKDDMKL